MVNAGASIEAFLKLDATPFKEGLKDATSAVDNFKTSMIDIGKEGDVLATGMNIVSKSLSNLVRELTALDTLDNKTINRFKQLGLAMEHISVATQKFGSDLRRGGEGLQALNEIMKVFQAGAESAEITLRATVSQIERLQRSATSSEESVRELNNSFKGTSSVDKQFKDMQNGLMALALDITRTGRVMTDQEAKAESNLEKLKAELNSINVTGFNNIGTGLNQLRSGFNSSYASAQKLNAELQRGSVATEEYNVIHLKTVDMLKRESLEHEKAVSYLQRQSEAMRTNASEKLRNMGYTGKLSMEEDKLAVSEEKQAVATDKATNSINRQSTASRNLGKALTSLKMIGSMVGSMIAYNFIHNLGKATNETINAKSEMNGYFEMLGYTTRQTQDFNKALQQTVDKFPRLNKYALGETISSIGVEFELSTKEMKKAMPVVSMITSEYLRAGRNVNEASLAVKDILQGEFQRLSRETGVKGDQLKEAGWSGDKNDVMGLLEALDKVGKARNWDTFVQKANSLNDAVLIMQNRFGEWSADMVEKVQPTILGVFNTLMVVAQDFAKAFNSVFDWLGGKGIGQSIVKWGGLATAISLVTVALIHARTGANLTQIAQMGLAKSIGATILGLEAETVAENGLRTSIVATVTGLEAETVADMGRSKALFSSILGLEIATVKEHGFYLALLESITGVEAETIALEGWNAQMVLAVAELGVVAGALAIVTGALVLQAIKIQNTTEKYAKFVNIVNKGDEIISDAKDSVDSLTKKKEKLTEKLSTLEKGTYKYNITADKLKVTTDDLTTATNNYNDAVNSVAWSKHKQELYDEEKASAQAKAQREINEALIDYGMNVEEAGQLSSQLWNEAHDGWSQHYETLQKVNHQYEMNGTTASYWIKRLQEEHIDPKEATVLIRPVISSGNDIADAKEELGNSTTVTEYVDKWMWLQVKQIKHAINEFNLRNEVDGFGDAIGGLLRGFFHGIDDSGMGSFLVDFDLWKGLDDWITPKLEHFPDWFDEHILNPITDFDWGSHISNAFSNFDLIGMIFDSILPASYATDGSSDHPSFMEDVSDILGFDIQEWIDNFPSNVLSGIGLGNFDVGEFIDGLFNVDVGNIGQWVQDNIIDPLIKAVEDGINNTPILGDISRFLGITKEESEQKGEEAGTSFTNGIQTGFAPLDGILNNTFNLDGIVSNFTNSTSTITSNASSTASQVATSFNSMKSNQKSNLDSMSQNNNKTFSDMKNHNASSLKTMKDATTSSTSHMASTFKTMSDSIQKSSSSLKTNSSNDFIGLGNVIQQFYRNIQNPASWSGISVAGRVASRMGAGTPTRTVSTPKPSSGRKAVRTIGGYRGAGINPYNQSPNKMLSLKDLMDHINPNEKVNVDDFLSMFSGGFGSWDFHSSHQSYIRNKSYDWDTARASVNGIGQVGHTYKVGRWKNGHASFTWDDFTSTASDIFSAIPYKFYYNSDWKGNWVNALLSGAVNCSDGADALINLARVFGFDGYKQHTTLKSGVGHFFAVINGQRMDTTNFQQHGSWSPLGGGIPVRTSKSTSNGETQGNTYNVTVDMNGAVIYGVEDLDERIEDGVNRGLQKAVNDPFTVPI